MPRKKIYENGWAKTPEGKAYHEQYVAEHYSRICVRFPKARREEIDRLSESAGLSYAAFLAEAVDAWKQLHNKD